MVVVVGVGTQRERRFAEINESLSRFENIPTPSVHPTEHHPMLSPNYHNLYLLKRPNSLFLIVFFVFLRVPSCPSRLRGSFLFVSSQKGLIPFS